MKKKIIYIFISLLVLYIAIISFFMYQIAHKPVPQKADYVLILGSKVDGDQMSPSLKERVKTALSYLQTHKQTKVIVTGGKGSDEEISEAEAAYRFLRKEGIEKDRIIKEDQSTSTFENFTFTKKKVDIQNKKVVLVSSDFHLFRSSIIAKRQGFHIYPLGAKTPNSIKLQAYFREYAAILKTWLFDK
ncbi:MULTISPECIES: YdcF family protein [Priestia]|uniref:YdcF family protein n=1 Tax=Priestia TaxID=2800373 RepID=UPI00203DD3B3|nr:MULTISPECIES: YdcF family protein [Priestia]MCM3770722.1 YdcF family protein [Priestia aryabhattai]MDY0941094.1 YdcF family protein [Priestia megaterium]